MLQNLPSWLIAWAADNLNSFSNLSKPLLIYAVYKLTGFYNQKTFTFIVYGSTGKLHTKCLSFAFHYDALVLKARLSLILRSLQKFKKTQFNKILKLAYNPKHNKHEILKKEQ